VDRVGAPAVADRPSCLPRRPDQADRKIYTARVAGTCTQAVGPDQRTPVPAPRIVPIVGFVLDLGGFGPTGGPKSSKISSSTCPPAIVNQHKCPTPGHFDRPLWTSKCGSCSGIGAGLKSAKLERETHPQDWVRFSGGSYPRGDQATGKRLAWPYLSIDACRSIRAVTTDLRAVLPLARPIVDRVPQEKTHPARFRPAWSNPRGLAPVVRADEARSAHGQFTNLPEVRILDLAPCSCDTDRARL
jgi:hypothetical protein